MKTSEEMEAASGAGSGAGSGSAQVPEQVRELVPEQVPNEVPGLRASVCSNFPSSEFQTKLRSNSADMLTWCSADIVMGWC